MAKKWEDVSSHSRGQPRVLNAVRVNCGGVWLTVHRHRDYPGKWCYSFAQISGPTPLDAKDLEEAKAEGLDFAKDIIYGIERDLENVEIRKGKS